MKILITGGAGTLGSNIIERLYKKVQLRLFALIILKQVLEITFLFSLQNLIEGSVSDLN